MAEYPNYDWNDRGDEALENRFPDWVLGYELWRENVFRDESVQRFDDFRTRIAGERLSRRPDGVLPGGITRVFVSHKKEDRDEALRTAWLVSQAGHAYWLDILDPQLAGSNLSPIRTAEVIEMALLNCTHLIALITSQSRSSRWVPYEYGRAKEPTQYSLNAASWLHPNERGSYPEYLDLGPTHRSENNISDWLKCTPPLPPLAWPGGPTIPLPK
jgi:hypothetical protein